MESPKDSAGLTGRAPGRGAASTERTASRTVRGGVDGVDQEGNENIKGDCVRIGDIVFLHGVDVPGLLFADGFVDETCWLGRNEGAMQDNDHELIMDSLFVVCVKNFHLAAERLRQVEKAMENIMDMSYSDALATKSAIKQLIVAMEEEQEANERETRRSLGTVVRYGDGIELKHLKSGKMLSIHKRGLDEPAGQGPHSRQGHEATYDITLSDVDSENQWFTVVPRFSIQNYSDPLRYGECLSLVAGVSTDQFLQANRRSFDDPAFGGNSGFYQHEVHTFRDIFGWQMGLYTPYKAEASASIEGGEVVRLFYKEEGLYVATGDADDDDDGNDDGNIYLDDEESGSYSFWRVELEDERSGATAEYGMLVRLRHLLTQQYLCYYAGPGGAETVRLCPQRNSQCNKNLPHTLIRLDPVFITAGPMKYNCCCHCKLESIGHYLHVTDVLASNRVKMLGTSPILRRDDGFAVLQVEGEQVQMIGRAVNIRTALQRFLFVLNMPDANRKLRQTVYNYVFILRLLEDTAERCSGDDLVTWQNMLRKAQVLALVAEVTVKMRDKLAVAKRMLHSGELQSVGGIFDAAHRVLQVAMRNNAANGRYLACKRGQTSQDLSLVEQLQRQLLEPACSKSVGATILCMLQDNAQVVRNFSPENKLFFIEHVADAEEHKALFLRLAAALACCEGKGVAESQDLIIQRWFKAKRELFVRTQVSDKGGLDMTLPVGHGMATGKAVDVEALADKANPHHRMLAYYEACLELFAAVCASQCINGRNLVGGRHGGWVNYDCLLLGITNEKLPVGVRVRYVRLVRMLYVERASEDYTQARETTQLLHEIDSSAVALPKPRFELEKSFREYRPLKTAVLQTLAACAAVIARGAAESAAKDDAEVSGPNGRGASAEAAGEEEAELAMELALVCEHLLKLGLFNNAEELSSTVIPTLLAHLSPPMGQTGAGKKASVSFKRSESLKEGSTAAKAEAAASDEVVHLGTHAVTTKLIVCRMLDYICDLRLRVRVPKLLALYKACSSTLSNAGKEGSGLTREEMDKGILHKLTEKLRTNHGDDMTKLLSFLSLSGPGLEGQRLAVTLVKMMHSKMEALSLVSMRLLLRERTPKLELFRELSNTQVLLDPGAISAYRSCIEHGSALSALLPVVKSELIANRKGRQLLPEEKLKARDRDRVCEAIKVCANMCVASTNSSDHLRVAAENKETVRRALIYLMVADVLEHYLDEFGLVVDYTGAHGKHTSGSWDAPAGLGRAGERGEKNKDAIEWWNTALPRACLLFVESFCRGCEKNQQLLAPHVRTILAFAGRGLHATRAVSAVYDGNLKLCRSLDEAIIARVVQIMAADDDMSRARRASKPKADMRKPHYVALLRALCSVKGTVMLQNHHYILKQLTQRGPLKLTPPRELKIIAEIDREAAERALLLFRGDNGERMRRRLLWQYAADDTTHLDQDSAFERLMASVDVADKEIEVKIARIIRALGPKVDAVVNALRKPSKLDSQAVPGGAAQQAKTKVVQLMAYNLELLSLILVILEDFNPDIAFVMRAFLPPTKIKDDVISPFCLPSAKAMCLQIMKSLYLKDDSSKRHPMLEEALWDMIAHLVDELKNAHLENFSRYVTNEAYALPERLCHFWAPMLLSAFKDRRLMVFMTDAQSSLGGALLNRLVDILNECSLHPHDAARLLAVYTAARERQVSTTAILSDQALEHAESVSDRDKLAIAGGYFVPAPGDQQQEAGIHTATDAGDQPQATPSEEDVSANVHRDIDLFARAFLDAVDPLHVNASGQDEEAAAEEEDSGSQEREELLALCEAFQDNPALLNAAGGVEGTGEARSTEGFGMNIVSAGAGGGGVVKEFNADNAIHLVNQICRYPRGRMGTPERQQWERDVIVGIKILCVLAKTWRSSVTEESPPPWLLVGVPRLLVQILSHSDCGDRVSVCCFELAIEVLKGGDANFQDSLYDIMMEHNGAPDLFAHLQDRLRCGEAEGRMSKRLMFEQGAHMTSAKQHSSSLAKKRDLHTLLVQVAKNDGQQMETSHVRLVVRFLHLLCEGHNMTLQNFLRHQPGSSRAVDMVSGVAIYVDAVTPYINPSIVEEVTTAMSALSEFVQNPCRANQLVLVNTRLCACANEILDMSASEETDDAEHKVEDGEYEGLSLRQRIEREQARDRRVAYQRAINELKAATATTLLSLLECVSQPYIPERMLASLDSDRLIYNMNGLLKLYAPWLLPKLKEKHESGEFPLHIPKHLVAPFEVSMQTIEEGVDEEAEVVAQHYYITFITLASFDKTGRLSRRCRADYIWDLANLQRKVGVVEISRKGLLEKAYFIVPRVCKYLTEASKQKLVHQVNRANLQTQLTDFAESLEPLYDEMMHQEQLTLSPLLNLFRLTSELREVVFFLNACVINVFILMFFAYECNGSFICGDDEDLITYRIKPGGKEVIFVLSILQCFLSITRQWWYVIERGIPLITRGIRQHRLKPPANSLWAAIVSLPPHQSDPTFRHRRIAQVQQGGLARFRLRKIDFVQPLYLLTDLNFWIITTMLLANLLALAVNHPGAPLFLLVHLMEIFNHSAILRNVIQSITYRGNSLIQTAILLIVMYYFFGVVGFLVFPEKFRLERPDVMGGRKLDPNNNAARCTSIWKCTLVVLDIGLRKGDLGEALEEIPWQVENMQVPNRNLIFYRMVYTFLFYVMVTTILMNIIFGIIIDTFAELREKKDVIDEMITGRCFICGIERVVFDQLSVEGNGFVDHIKNDHNMWKYIYFLVYLKERDYEDMSGGESFVFHRTLQLVMDPDTHEVVRDRRTNKELKIAKPKVDLLWYPQRDAMVLTGQRSSVDQELMTKLDKLQTQTKRFTSVLTSKVDDVLNCGVKISSRNLQSSV